MMIDRKDKRYVSCPVCGRILMKCQGQCNIDIIESAFYNKENLSPNMHGQEPKSKTVSVPDGVDTELLMKVLENPEMAALLTSLAKTMKV